MTRTATFIDDVRGTIIGDMPPIYRGRLHYEGRPQGESFRADSEAELMEMARKRKHDLLTECGEVAYQIYPNDTWELRIYS